jgi:hypothetical protein
MASDTCVRSSRLAEHAVTGLAVGLMVRRALELVAVIKSGRWSRRRLASLGEWNGAIDGEVRTVCVIPMYLEQDIVTDTVRFWHDLAQRTALSQVVFVTTAKEQAGGGAMTQTLVAAELAVLATSVDSNTCTVKR